MSLVIAVVLLLAVTLLYTLFVRAKDIPPPEPVSPTRHLDERKAAIYENLRDLQFEYRVGKLSDADYQQTKLALQRELAVVLAEIESIVKTLPAQPAKPVPKKAVFICPHCGKQFPAAMKFCGECGKEMTA
jgi:rRNA maturation endonuclease Nob1